jgi:hypothetical protein
MAKSLSRQELRRLALFGAQTRLDALRTETQSILAAFPELQGRTRTRKRAAAAASTAPVRRRRRRWKMSAEQKKAVSERMRKYWAARRKASK